MHISNKCNYLKKKIRTIYLNVKTTCFNFYMLKVKYIFYTCFFLNLRYATILRIVYAEITNVFKKSEL